MDARIGVCLLRTSVPKDISVETTDRRELPPCVAKLVAAFYAFTARSVF